jgi:hypothetical protein
MQVTSRHGCFTLEKIPVPIEKEAEQVPEPFWTI